MAPGRRQRPYRQGHLDSLCGLYAVLNALDLLHPLDAGACSHLTSRLIDELEKRGLLADAMAGGMTESMVWRLANIAADYLLGEEGVRLATDRPFRGRHLNSLEDFLYALDARLRRGGAAIICIAGAFELDHWSTVRGVTRHTVQLQDSAGMHFLRRTSCAVSRERSSTKVRLCRPRLSS